MRDGGAIPPKSTKNMSQNKETLEKYKEAVWDFMLEHCDITPNGSIFVKFHCDHRLNFEKRIHARIRGYHRTDVKARQEHIDTVRNDAKAEKEMKRQNYLRTKKGRRLFGRFYPLVRFIYEKKLNTRK